MGVESKEVGADRRVRFRSRRTDRCTGDRPSASNENIVYFGDTARVPYGSKSRQTIIRFSEQIIRF